LPRSLRPQVGLPCAGGEEKAIEDRNAEVDTDGPVPASRDLVSPYRRASARSKGRNRRAIKMMLSEAELLGSLCLIVQRQQVRPVLERNGKQGGVVDTSGPPDHKRKSDRTERDRRGYIDTSV
jgi:hypothetical protein